ncbi:MAG: hypothetical protein HY435_01865 [Candidatus Liptonbacteria bacterium]|nr:hypothetical protein [Candidatus Liptonbacteria bacterium]
MKFELPVRSLNIANVARELGYRPLGYTPDGEMNCVRPLGADYPRFHLYLKETGDMFLFSLHLDQKRPSYGRETAHSGDYDGEVIEDEARRIKEKLQS